MGVLPGCVEYEIGPSRNRQLVKQLDVRKMLRGTLRQTQFPTLNSTFHHVLKSRQHFRPMEGQ